MFLTVMCAGLAIGGDGCMVAQPHAHAHRLLGARHVTGGSPSAMAVTLLVHRRTGLEAANRLSIRQTHCT